MNPMRQRQSKGGGTKGGDQNGGKAAGKGGDFAAGWPEQYGGGEVFCGKEALSVTKAPPTTQERPIKERMANATVDFKKLGAKGVKFNAVLPSPIARRLVRKDEDDDLSWTVGAIPTANDADVHSLLKFLHQDAKLNGQRLASEGQKKLINVLQQQLKNNGYEPVDYEDENKKEEETKTEQSNEDKLVKSLTMAFGKGIGKLSERLDQMTGLGPQPNGQKSLPPVLPSSGPKTLPTTPGSCSGGGFAMGLVGVSPNPAPKKQQRRISTSSTCSEGSGGGFDLSGFFGEVGG